MTSSFAREQVTLTTRVTLERGEQEAEVQIQQVTVENLRRLFRVNPAETYLRDNITNNSYFPQANGTFRLIEEGVTPYATLIVEGRGVDESLHSSSSSTSSAAATNYGSALSLSSTPLAAAGSSGSSTPSPGFHAHFRSVMPTKRERTMPTATFTLRILKARMRRMGRKVELYENDQAFIQLTEATANVQHIINMASQEWREDRALALVTHDGLQINHSTATQGLSFWKAPRRKVYAVLQSELISNDTTSSDDDYVAAPAKRSKRNHKRLREQITSLQTDLQEMRSHMNNSLPSRLQQEILGTFKCCMCQVAPIVRSPIMVAKCCGSIVGCQDCFNELRREESQEYCCPLCRGSNFDCIRLNGLDGFLGALTDSISETA